MKIKSLKAFIYNNKNESIELENITSFDVIKSTSENVSVIKMLNTIFYFNFADHFEKNALLSLPKYDMFVTFEDENKIKYDLRLSNIDEPYQIELSYLDVDDDWKKGEVDHFENVSQYLKNILLFEYDHEICHEPATIIDVINEICKINYNRYGPSYKEILFSYLNFIGFKIDSLDIENNMIYVDKEPLEYCTNAVLLNCIYLITILTDYSTVTDGCFIIINLDSLKDIVISNRIYDLINYSILNSENINNQILLLVKQ